MIGDEGEIFRCLCKVTQWKDGHKHTLTYWEVRSNLFMLSREYAKSATCQKRLLRHSARAALLISRNDVGGFGECLHGDRTEQPSHEYSLLESTAAYSRQVRGSDKIPHIMPMLAF